MLCETQPVHNQQLPDTCYRTLSPWTVCLLLGCFLPIPTLHQRPITLVTRAEQTIGVKSSSPVAYKALPPELKLGPSTLAEVGRARKNLAIRVMDRLQQAEAHESHAHRRQDYRQAWITVSFAHKDRPEPFLESSYVVYGVHPDKVFPRWLEDQKARLGREFYLFYNDEGVLRPDIPKFSPTTAHRANEADSANWDGSVGLVPTKQEVV